ncbi:hypothetical protein ACWC91_10060 [Streptomyces sp. NPDC001204]
MAMRGRPARVAQGRRSAPSAEAASSPVVTGAVEGSWLVRGKDGRLTAYARCPDGLLRWTETRPGGPDWSGPDLFPVAGLTRLTVAQGADTYVHFLGRRERRGADGTVRVDVVHAIQYQSGRPVTEWRSLGNPHREPDRTARLGAPTGAVDAKGTVHVFVRNAGGGLMMRREGKGGGWEPWTDLRGSDLRDGLTAAVTSTDHVEVFAPTADALAHWIQPEPGAVPQRSHDMRPGPLPGSVTAVETAPGRLTCFWTDASGSGLLSHRRGSWLVTLGGTPSDGANAVLRTTVDGYDCTVIAHRGAAGGILFGVCGTEAESSGMWWTDAGGNAAGAPALAHDGYGRVVVAAFGPDGALRLARQAPEPGLVLMDWVRV